MVERNLFKEGYISNTLTLSGTISGTQTIGVNEINLLVDGDTVIPALTLASGKKMVLDFDLGARWAIKRFEYYTSEASTASFSIKLSQDNSTYTPIALSNVGAYFLGQMPVPVASGAPRYIRLEHTATSGTLIREFVAVSDDTKVDFGTDGSVTQVSLNDSPLGEVSRTVTVVPIFNRSTTQAVDARVFIDRTFNSSDDELEISAAEVGPWVGRNTAQSTQPLNTDWDNGLYTNTRKVPGISYSVNFSEDGVFNRWATSGLTSVAVTGGFLQGVTRSGTCTFETTASGLRVIAPDCELVKVSLKVPTISGSYTPPTLFWKNNGATTYSADKSILPTNTRAYNGQLLEYTYPVSTITTWSGVISDIKIVPFVATSGIAVGHLVQLSTVDIGNFDGGRIALDSVPVKANEDQIIAYKEENWVASTSFLAPIIYLNYDNRILAPCVITKFKMSGSPEIGSAAVETQILLLSMTSSFPASGTVTIKKNLSFSSIISATQANSYTEVDVFWPATSGDAIGVFFRSSPGPSDSANCPVGTTPKTGAGYRLTAVTVPSVIGNLPVIAGTGAWTGTNVNYLIGYDYLPLKFSSSGRYTAPVFDLGDAVELSAAVFTANEPANTSVDTDTSSAFSTINGRASNTPPHSSSLTTINGVFTGERFKYNDTLPFIGPYDVNSIWGTISTNDQFQVPTVSVYNQDTQELWVLASICSGTAPYTVSPVINVFDAPANHNRARSFQVQGIGYTYSNSLNPTTFPQRFDPIGMVIDYARKEVYIVCSDPSFFAGSVAYHGIVIDYSGNFKRLVFRKDQITVIASTINKIAASKHMVFDGVYFYFLSVATGPASNLSATQSIYIFKLHSDLSITEVDTKVVSAISGLSFSNASHPPRAMGYHSADNLVYLLWNNTVLTDFASNDIPTASVPRYYALKFTPDVSDIFTVQLYKQGTADIAIPQLTTTQGYTRKASSNQNWVANGGWFNNTTQWFFIRSMTYLPNRNTFAITTYEASTIHPEQDPMSSLSVGFFTEIGAGVSGTWSAGTLANPNDSLWGSASGTLSYQPVQKDSVLFPNGRYAQVDYTLNSTNGVRTPQITDTGFIEGVVLQGVPASGTRNLYVRSNIPSDADLSTRIGRLKAYWQLNE